MSAILAVAIALLLTVLGAPQAMAHTGQVASVWEGSLNSAVMYQAALEALPLAALRLLGWVLAGFGLTLACWLAAVLAASAREWWHDPGMRSMR